MRIVGEFTARKSASLSKTESAALLEKVRAKSKQVNPRRLGFVGRLETYSAYARTVDVFPAGPSGSIKAKRVKLLSGGNPQIAKAYGDAPEQLC